MKMKTVQVEEEKKWNVSFLMLLCHNYEWQEQQALVLVELMDLMHFIY